jgi:hypothetical protein
MTSGFPAVVSKNILSDAIRGLLVGRKSSIRIIKYADSNEHLWATIHQIVAPEPWHVSHYRHKAFLDTTCQLFDCALFYRVSSNAAEHGPILRQPIDPISYHSAGSYVEDRQMGPHAIRNNLHTIPSRIEGSQRGDMVMLDFPQAANSAPPRSS